VAAKAALRTASPGAGAVEGSLVAPLLLTASVWPSTGNKQCPSSLPGRGGLSVLGGNFPLLILILILILILVARRSRRITAPPPHRGDPELLPAPLNQQERKPRNTRHTLTGPTAEILPPPHPFLRILLILRSNPVENILHFLCCSPIKTWYCGIVAALTRLFFEMAQGKGAGENRMTAEGKRQRRDALCAVRTFAPLR
jgi:hypothetical protein